MGLQIVEIALDADGNAIDRKEVGIVYESRVEAVERVEGAISKYASFGYEKQQDCWWARTADGDRLRFIIEAV